MKKLFSTFVVACLCLAMTGCLSGAAFDKQATALELVVRAGAGRVLTEHPAWTEATYRITGEAIKAIAGDQVVSLDGLEGFVFARISWDSLSPEEKDLLLVLVGAVKKDIQNYLNERGVEKPREAMVRVATVLKWINQTAEIRRGKAGIDRSGFDRATRAADRKSDQDHPTGQGHDKGGTAKMRVSMKKNDPGYVEDGHNYEVFLNGEKLEGCVTADEEKGEVTVYERDRDGRILMDIFDGDVLVKEKIPAGEQDHLVFGENKVASFREKLLTGTVEVRKAA